MGRVDEFKIWADDLMVRMDKQALIDPQGFIGELVSELLHAKAALIIAKTALADDLYTTKRIEEAEQVIKQQTTNYEVN